MRPGDGLYPWVQIKRVAAPGTGHTPSRERPDLWVADECVLPWFTLADVWQIRDGGRSVVTTTAERVSVAGIAGSSAVLHPAGTVLLSRTASVGFSAVMGTDMAVSQDYMTWTPGRQLDSRFLLYVLRGQRQEFERLMSGSTHKTIYMPELLALRTPLPPVERQREIAAFLDRECARLDDLVDAAKALGASLAAVSRETFARMTADAPQVRLRFALRSIEQGWSPVCDDREVDAGQWGVLKLGCVNGGSFRDVNKALSANLTPRPELEVHDGDLLMSRANTRELVGSAAVACGIRPRLMLSDLLYRLHLERGWEAEFLSPAIGTARVRSQIEAVAAGSAGSMPKLNQQSIKNLQVPNLPWAEQRIVIEANKQAATAPRAALAECNALHAELREYRDALITEAVTGQLDVLRVSVPQMEERLAAVREGERPGVLAT